MTREVIEAIEYIKTYRKLDEDLYNTAPKGSVSFYATEKCLHYWDMAIEALEQEPEKRTEERTETHSCDYISRQAVLDIDFKRIILTTAKPAETIEQKVKALPSVRLSQDIIRCEECKFYTNFQKSKPWNVSKRYCNRIVTMKTSPNDFCSFAEARVSDSESEDKE